MCIHDNHNYVWGEPIFNPIFAESSFVIDFTNAIQVLTVSRPEISSLLVFLKPSYGCKRTCRHVWALPGSQQQKNTIHGKREEFTLRVLMDTIHQTLNPITIYLHYKDLQAVNNYYAKLNDGKLHFEGGKVCNTID